MILKRYALLGSALITLGLPILAGADLITWNHTDQYSTVRITSPGSHYCSADNPFNEKTAPHNSSKTSIAQVKTLCQVQPTQSICSVDVYASAVCNEGMPPAQHIAHLDINVKTLAVSNIVIDNPKYKISFDAPTVTVTIDPVA